MKLLIIVYILIFLVGIFFKLYGLAYSNFQGDEAKVVEVKELQNYHDLKEFFTHQLKGPGQYLVTYITNDLVSSGDTEYIYRLPFAIATSIGLLIYAIFLIKNFDIKTSIASLLLFTSSGLIIALSRIVQYQAFMLFLRPLALLLFSVYITKLDRKYLILSGLVSGIAFIFHFDVVSIVIPIVIYLIINKKYKRGMLFSSSFMVAPLILYFVLFYKVDLTYLFDYLIKKRISGDFDYDSFYYSVKLLKIYHPVEYLIILFGFAISFCYRFFKDRLLNVVFTLFLITIFLRLVNVTPDKNIAGISLLLIGFCLTYKYSKFQKWSVENFVTLYALLVFIGYFLVLSKPLTHIYTIFIPICVISGIAIGRIKNLKVYTTCCMLILISSISFNYQAFINTKPEYPWNEKNYLLGPMNNEVAKGEKIDGIFGFPYNREFQEINAKLNMLSKSHQIYNYDSNEKSKITNFYVKGLNRSGNKPNFYVYIKNPQSFEIKKPASYEVIENNEKYDIYIIR